MNGKLIDFDAFNSENDISDIEVELTGLYDEGYQSCNKLRALYGLKLFDRFYCVTLLSG